MLYAVSFKNLCASSASFVAQWFRLWLLPSGQFRYSSGIIRSFGLTDLHVLAESSSAGSSPSELCGQAAR